MWRALEALVDEGKIRSLGCSNMTPKKLHALWAGAVHKPVNVQVRTHARTHMRMHNCSNP